MGFANRVVIGVLRSPLHRLLSGSTAVLRWTGRRSGRSFTTPVQYAPVGDGLVILVGRPERKTWWRNFRQERDLEVLCRGEWRAMTGLVVTGAAHPERLGPLLQAYVARFPRAARGLDESGPDGTVVVRCQPRAR